jgi:hypothetical protein
MSGIKDARTRIVGEITTENCCKDNITHLFKIDHFCSGISIGFISELAHPRLNRFLHTASSSYARGSLTLKQIL